MKKIIIALVAVGALVGASAASAGTFWADTPSYVAKALKQHWNTSDGVDVVAARCRGNWNAQHIHDWRGEEFHKLMCSQVDKVGRVFVVNVTVVGRGTVARGVKLQVVQERCDSSASDYRCP